MTDMDKFNATGITLYVFLGEACQGEEKGRPLTFSSWNLYCLNGYNKQA